MPYTEDVSEFIDAAVLRLLAADPQHCPHSSLRSISAAWITSHVSKTAGVLAFLTCWSFPLSLRRHETSLTGEIAARTIVEHLTDAWNGFNGAAYGMNFWPEAELGYPVGNVLTGRSAIVQEHLNLWAGPFKGSQSEATRS